MIAPLYSRLILDCSVCIKNQLCEDLQQKVIKFSCCINFYNKQLFECEVKYDEIIE